MPVFHGRKARLDAERVSPTHRPKYIEHEDFENPIALRKIVERLDERINDNPPAGSSEELELFKASHACGWFADRSRDRRGRLTITGRRWLTMHYRILDHIVNANLGLVYDMWRRSRTVRGEIDDMLSEGLWTLYQAATNFNPWKGVRFSTYACTAIIRGFHLVSKRDNRRKRAMLDIYERQVHDPTTRIVLPLHTESTVTVGFVRDLLTAEDTGLTSVERFVLQRRIMSGGHGPAPTLESVGQLINVSKERVRQIQQSGLEKLRGVLERRLA